MFIVKKENQDMYSLPAKELKAKQLKTITSPLANKILRYLDKPTYAADIARALGVHEQKIYYHIRKLEQSGIIRAIKQETKQGGLAQYYERSEPAFFTTFADFDQTSKITQLRNESQFLEPFIADGKLNALIVVGSPDPHGPDKARSRDGYYGMDLALFLGTFLNYVPQFNVKLDTEVTSDDLKQNLILIGGPIVNKTTAKFNAKLPVRFEKGSIISSISQNEYPQDESGLIVKVKNQFNKEKSILVVAGKRFSGTRAAIIAFLKNFKEITKGNTQNENIKAKVVEGIDADSDGIIDSVEFLE